MAVTLTERPYKYSFSENEIRYTFHISNPTDAGCALEIEVYTKPPGASASLFHSFRLYPDPDGTVYCNLKTTLTNLVTPELPDPNGARVQPVTNQVHFFYIKYRQVTTADSNPDWKSEASYTRTMLWGGVEKMKFKQNNFFSAYLPANKPFLTWMPANRFIFPDQPVWLTFVLLEPKIQFSVLYRAVYTTGFVNDQFFAIDNPAGDILFRVKADVAALGILFGQLHYFEVSVLDENNAHLAKPYRLYVEYNQLYRWHDMQYFSSLGGLDSIRLKGEYNQEVNITGDDLEHIIFKDSADTREPQEQFSQVNIFKKDVYKGDAGFLHTLFQQRALQEMFLHDTYQWIDDRWIKVLNLKKSQDLGSSQDMKWSFPVEWSYGYEDSVFTPKEIMLGAGIQEPVLDCTGVVNPVNLAVTPLGLLPGSVYVYKATWDYDAPLTIGNVIAEVSTDNVNWMPRTITVPKELEYSFGTTPPIEHWVRISVICPYDASVIHTITLHVTTCAASIHDTRITAQTLGGVTDFSAVWVNPGAIPPIFLFEISLDHGVTWTSADPPLNGSQVTNARYDYTINGGDNVEHILRITPKCSSILSGTPEETTYTP